MSTLAWNPRYANYARLHGHGPDTMLALDKERTPGACMMKFMLWNGERIREFREVRPEAFTGAGLSDHDAYDAWLAAWVDRATMGAAA